MSQVVGLKFNNYRPVLFYRAAPYQLQKGEHVLIKAEEGVSLGQVVIVREQEERDAELEPVYRLATREDLCGWEENQSLERESFLFCRQCIQQQRLNMKLVGVEVFFDRTKMIFYFTAPGRIDFRDLVKELVQHYRTRIELRQIGVRHETQMLGTIGSCGQVCCCRRFLRQFEPVTIKMAKDQDLFLNPAKISGSCGRLLCCLAYEKDTYIEFRKRLPKMGRWTQTQDGRMRPLRANLFRNSLTVLTDQNEEREIFLDEWQGLVQGAEDAEKKQESKVPGKLHADREEKPGSDKRNRPYKSGKPVRGHNYNPDKDACESEVVS